MQINKIVMKIVLIPWFNWNSTNHRLRN